MKSVKRLPVRFEQPKRYFVPIARPNLLTLDAITFGPFSFYPVVRRRDPADRLLQAVA